MICILKEVSDTPTKIGANFLHCWMKFRISVTSFKSFNIVLFDSEDTLMTFHSTLQTFL